MGDISIKGRSPILRQGFAAGGLAKTASKAARPWEKPPQLKKSMSSIVKQAGDLERKKKGLLKRHPELEGKLK